MPIKHKALFILLSISLVTFVAINLLLYFFITYNFQKVEDEEAIRNFARVNYLLESHVKELEVKVTDYAVWDDANNFVKTLDAKFINDNYRDDVFSNLGLNYMLFFDKKDKFVYGKYLDTLTGSITDVSPTAIEAFTNVVIKHSANVERGLLTVDALPVCFAMHALLPGSGEGTSNGTLLFAKEFNNDDMDKITNLAKINVSFTPISTLSTQEANLLSKYYTTPGYYINYTKNNLNLWGVVKDVENNPILRIHIDEYRKLYSRAIDLLLGIWLLYAIIMLFSVLIWSYYADKLIFKRLRNLATQVYQMKLSRSFEHRLRVDGSDEISQLGNNINELLLALSKSENNYLKANESLKNKAAELEKKTEELEKLNQFMVGREVRMSQLKKQIEELQNKLQEKV